ncbi:MAG TPA: hypothetical protein PKV41_03840 [Candidatus Omnitrophota bacterium]|nr:hypothetical protein [Candidatus Omnitrophota bacterium]
MENIAQRNTFERSPVSGFMKPETVFVNLTGVSMALKFHQVLAGVFIDKAATSPAASATRLPFGKLLVLPFSIFFLFVGKRF